MSIFLTIPESEPISIILTHVHNLRRILTGFWWLFVIVTVTTYCGNLVAFLTFPTIEYPISDLNTLVEKVGGSANVSISIFEPGGEQGGHLGSSWWICH